MRRITRHHSQRAAGVCCSPCPRVEYGAERHQSGATAPCSLPGAIRCEEALFTLETVNRPDNEAAFTACDGRALEQAATRRLRLRVR